MLFVFAGEECVNSAMTQKYPIYVQLTAVNIEMYCNQHFKPVMMAAILVFPAQPGTFLFDII